MAEINSSTLQDNGTGRRTHLKVDWEQLDEWAKSDPYKELRERNAKITGNQEETEDENTSK